MHRDPASAVVVVDAVVVVALVPVVGVDCDGDIRIGGLSTASSYKRQLF